MGLVNLLPAIVLETHGGAGVVAAGPLRLRVGLPSGIAARDRVDLAIRPESIRISAPNGAAGGAVPARIEERTYLGNLSEYYVSLDAGLRLRVQAPALADFPIGSAVRIAVDTDQVSAFSASAEPEQPIE